MLLLVVGSASASAQTSQDLASVQQQAIAATREVQQGQQARDSLEHQTELIDRDIAGRQRDLDDSRPEQAHLLGALEMLALQAPNHAEAAGRIDRQRGAMLVRVMAPQLRAEGQALIAEILQTAELRKEHTAHQQALTTARDGFAAAKRNVAQLVSQRTGLLRHLLPDYAAGDARLLKQARDAASVMALIEAADDAAERRDRELRASGRVAASKGVAAGIDPTHPSHMRAFDPPQSLLAMPAMGSIAPPSNAGDGASPAVPVVDIIAAPGAIVAAPFDGRIVYAGPFRDLGLVLIIRHGDLYHSILAGLGHIDVLRDEWVLAGEPLGAMPEAQSGLLHFEMVGAGHAVDPRPWLATPDIGHDDESVDRKVTR